MSAGLGLSSWIGRCQFQYEPAEQFKLQGLSVECGNPVRAVPVLPQPSVDGLGALPISDTRFDVVKCSVLVETTEYALARDVIYPHGNDHVFH